MGVFGWRRLRRYRTWWPPALAILGALVAALPPALSAVDADRGIAGPVVATGVIAGFAGLLTGVAEGIVQPSDVYRPWTGMALVVLVLLAAAALSGGQLAAAPAVLFGSGVALGARWCGLSIMEALVGRDDDED